MKRLILATIVCCLFAGTGFAADSVILKLQAQVPLMLELSYWIRTCPSDSTPYGPGSADSSNLGFGRLKWDETNKIWVSDRYFTVFMVAMSSGRSYHLRQSCGGFISSSTGKTLNKNVLMTPDYNENDLWNASDASTVQGPMDSRDRLGPKDLAVGTDRLIYEGNAADTTGPRIVRCYYGVATGDPSAHEPSTSEVLSGKAPAGDYSGMITFSLVLK